MKPYKKATLDDLIARKQQSQNDKVHCKEVYSKVLDATLLLKKPSLNKIFDAIDLSRTGGAAADYEANKILVYDACELFHEPKLLEAYECTEPYDVVGKIFEHNIPEIARISQEVLGFYGYGSDDNMIVKEEMPDEVLKN